MRGRIGTIAPHRRRPAAGEPDSAATALAISSSVLAIPRITVTAKRRPTRVVLAVASFDPTSPTD